jgi:hypothetical protein
VATEAQIEEVRSAARRFVFAAFESLSSDRVIPTSRFYNHIRIARDYFGPSLQTSGAEGALERCLEQTFPEQFRERKPPSVRDFPSSYAYSLLEATVTRCARADSFEAPDRQIEESIDELLAVLDSPTHELVCCRVVSHLTARDDDTVQVAGIEVVPEVEGPYPGQGGHNDILQRIAEEIPQTGKALNREQPFPWDRPHALLIARQTLTDTPTWEGHGLLAAEIDLFLLVLRLLTGSTTESFYEVEGPSTLVAGRNADFRQFPKGFYGAKVRRTVRLTGDETPAFKALEAMIEGAQVKQEGVAATAFEIAIGRFASSYSIPNEYERIVALATALEATLSGEKNDNDAIVYKLRGRGAALLATADDPARTISEDIALLYGLRSTLVHGGAMKEKTLGNIISKISSDGEELSKTRAGVAAGMAADRMREIVRRAILARLCLAETRNGFEPLWPLGGSTPVDAILADDATRAAWRAHWRDRLAELGAGSAAEKAEAAVDWLSDY